MESELKSFLEVWSLVIISLCYTYYLASKMPRGFLRLLSILPILALFLYLPMKLSSFVTRSTSSLFLSWFANFKLILFSFDLGPLSPLPPKLHRFISIASLPIKIKQFPSQKDQTFNPIPRTTSLVIKVLALHIIFQAYNHRSYLSLNTTFLLSIFPILIMLETELMYKLFEIPAKFLLGTHQLDPQFAEPLLSTSLQDFWGKRWNLICSDVLRDTIYNPSRRVSMRIIGPKWATLPAIFVTFLVSGLFHELLNYHLLHCLPTWEATCYFIIHGVCVDIEIWMKKKNVKIIGESPMLNIMSRVLVLGFLLGTTRWLLFAPWLRYGLFEKTFLEYSMIVDFLKELVLSIKNLRS